MARRTVEDVREAPAYTFAEVSRYLHVPAATVRVWVAGLDTATQQFEPLIRRPVSGDKRLSFNNVVEVHVLRALRTRHGVSMPGVRKALEYAETACGVPRLLIHRDLMAGAGEVFLDRYSDLVALSRGGQLVLRDALTAHLERVVYDPQGVPLRLYPWLPSPSRADCRTIVLDPHLGFGNPVTEHGGISTAVLVSRYEAGESLDEIAADYDLESRDVADAIQFERAA